MPPSRFVEGELTSELGRSVGPASLTFLRTDRRVRKASWQGEVVRRGTFVRRLRPLVSTLAAPPAVRRAAGDLVEPAPVAEASR